MHSAYYFLLDVPDGTAPPALGDLAAEAFEQRFSERCDENNWYSLLCVSARSGERFCYPGVSGSAPSYDQTLRSAHLAVVRDCVFYAPKSSGLPDLNPMSLGPRGADESRLDSLSVGELDRIIRHDVPPVLARLYASAVSDDQAEKGFDLESYGRGRLAQLYERYRQCALPPFSTGGDPYCYPCFDLTYGEPLDVGAAILTVDIHT